MKNRLENGRGGHRSMLAPPSIGALCERFLAFKHHRVEDGELSPRTIEGYQRVCDDLLGVLGPDRPLGQFPPEDFDRLRRRFASHLGPRAVGSFIRMTRTLFRWAYEMGLLDRPMRYGGMFDAPRKRAVRAAADPGCGLVRPEDVLALLSACEGTRMHAFVLLGINCGYGNADCSELDAAHVDQALASGVLSFPRPKTGSQREAVLWPETAESLRWNARRAGPAFLTHKGNRYVRALVRQGNGRPKVVHIDSLGLELRKVVDRLGLSNGSPAPIRQFYNLRRTFRTVADELGDHHAVARVMGHEVPGMAGVYVRHIGRDRLQAVSDHVHRWLFT